MAEDRIVLALAENLSLVYPNGPPADENLIRTWLQEIMEQSEDSVLEGDDQSATYDRALKRAVDEWKEKCTKDSKKPKANDSSKKASKSFSLFSQLDSGMWGPRIELEDLQSASTAEERLTLLEKVAHVDDLVLDWKEVLPLLQDGLSLSVDEYAKLHRKWFDQGRSSQEHLHIRCELCHNILDAILNLVVEQWEGSAQMETEKFCDVHENVFSLWTLWFEMWFDLLQEPIGHAEENGSLATMAHEVLFLMRDLDTGGDDKQSTSIYPAHFLALVDPSATWFHAWTIRLTPSELMKALQSSHILPDLWQRASTKTESMATEDCQTRQQLLEVVLKQQSVSMLKSILVCTRTHQFPAALIWEEGRSNLTPTSPLPLVALADAKKSYEVAVVGASGRDVGQTPLGTGASSVQLRQLFQLFFDGVASISAKSDENPVAIICVEAIEVILLGAKLQSKEGNSSWNSMYEQMLKQCKELTTGECKQCYSLRLAKILESLDG